MEKLSDTYQPASIEKDIYKWWEKNGYFRPEKQRELGLVDSKSPRFCLTLPPPNVTGQLHLGHAITIAIEDFLVRYNRLRRKETLFLPGSDHAGIATQNVVERELRKKGIHRKDLGREKFIEKVWEWKHEYHARITEQSKRMGMSSDWTRERFTLDEKLSAAVLEAFVRLYKKGLIYRGNYMVNWCPRCESAISNLEAEPEEKESSLWYIKYPIITDDWDGPKNEWGSGEWAKGATEFIEVATTRPETLLGDTGVAVAEKHPKYEKYIGKFAVLPGNNRRIPIFVDPYVDPEFGTGALKITPAHDPNDYEIGKKYNLNFITVIDEAGRMTSEHAGKYVNMDRFECRDAIVEDLKKEGLLNKIESYVHSEPTCQRCHTVIEPRISLQWFVKTKEMAKAALKAVQSGVADIIPEREKKRFYQWMEGIQDWCISRQLWWGHRIPVWYCSNGHEICDKTEPKKCPICGDTNLERDPDVLDTWFSSGLWPFSTLGWPDTSSQDFLRFYPTDVRETGYDILFFWVAREMMLGCELTGKPPYHTIYLHGIIRNEKGKKISKSMEDVYKYDPLNIINAYGADTLRYVLTSNAVPGKDINLDPRQFEPAHRFCNKIWQSTRYVLGHLNENEVIPKFDANFPHDKLCLADKWILSRLNKLIGQITDYIENYDLLNATRSLKNFYWGEFCDWYIEMTKTRLYDESTNDKITPKVILFHVLTSCLKMLHPVIPFITEALWQALPASVKETDALMVAKWPDKDDSLVNDKIENGFNIIIELIKEVRRTKIDFNIPPATKIPIIIEAQDVAGVIKDLRSEICMLAKIDPDKLKVEKQLTTPRSKAAKIVLKEIMAYIPLEDLIDIETEKKRIQNKINKLEKQIESKRKKLAGPFAEKAPKEIVENEREKLIEFETQFERLKEQLKSLK
ncbi:MAG: valine--tRNA ligase [Promethearchaeota archaeon]